MIGIYFDGTLIDEDYYAGIKNNFKLFDNVFQLGTTTSNTFTISVPASCFEGIPQEVVIKIDGEDYAHLVVDSYKYKNNDMVDFTLTDKMTFFDFKYNAQSIVPCTVKDILEDICDLAGVELGTEDFTNSDISVDFYDNTVLARTYIGYIAELNGGYAQIGKDGKLYLKKFDSTPISISLDDCEDFKVGEHHEVERVVFDNGLLKYETSQDETLETLYLRSDNPYIMDETTFENIADEIMGFEFYSFSTKNSPIVDATAGELITFTDGTNSYQTIAQYKLSHAGSSWYGKYELNINSQRQQETQIIGEKDAIKDIQTKVNRNTAQLNIQASEISELDSSVSGLEISVSGLESDVENIETDVAQTIKTITPYYAVNNSKTDAPSSGWSTTMPTREVNQYMWRKDLITLQNDTSYYQTPYVITGDRGNDGASGSEIWTTSTAPTTPNYTFNISDLLGPPGDPVVGDIILYSYYRYTINTVSTTTVKAGNRQSLRGAKGDTGDTGPAGQDGAPGQDGTDGSQWYQGTAITGTSGDLTGHEGVVDDQYLNSSTGNTYVCVTTGTSSTAIWHYSGNIKGADGQDATITSDTPPLNPTEDMLWLDTTNNQLKKYTLAADQGGTITGTWNIVNDYSDAINNVQTDIENTSNTLQSSISGVENRLSDRVTFVENKYTSMKETQEGFELRVGTIETFKSSAETVINNVESSFTFGDSLTLGKSNSDYKFQLTNEGANILYKNNVTSYWDPHNFNSDGIQANQLGIGPFKFALRSNGSLSLRKEGD